MTSTKLWTLREILGIGGNAQTVVLRISQFRGSLFDPFSKALAQDVLFNIRKDDSKVNCV